MSKKWEYNFQVFTAAWDEGTSYAMSGLMKAADQLGQNGWEMVNFSLVNVYTDSVGKGKTAMQAVQRMECKMWSVAAMFKRPIE